MNICGLYGYGDIVGKGVFEGRNLSLYAYGAQNPVKFIDPDGNEAIAFQVREGNNTIMYVMEKFENHEVKYYKFDVKETAPTYSPKNGVKYGEGAKLEPGIYQMDSRQNLLKETDISQKGATAVYTTMGESPGNIVNSDGTKRGYLSSDGKPVTNHKLGNSEGCPMFVKEKELKIWNSIIERKQTDGGTKVIVIEVPKGTLKALEE